MEAMWGGFLIGVLVAAFFMKGFSIYWKRQDARLYAKFMEEREGIDE